jgi:hypothetical protein
MTDGSDQAPAMKRATEGVQVVVLVVKGVEGAREVAVAAAVPAAPPWPPGLPPGQLPAGAVGPCTKSLGTALGETIC